jgi:isopenicillin N synthase-like dioxygenase
MALGLDPPADFFADNFADGMDTLTPIHYTPASSSPGQMFGAGAHTELGESQGSQHWAFCAAAICC